MAPERGGVRDGDIHRDRRNTRGGDAALAGDLDPDGLSRTDGAGHPARAVAGAASRGCLSFGRHQAVPMQN